jgi:hypothetical protein
MTPLAREFLLVAACCRWPLGVEVIRQAAGGGIDWPYLLRIVQRQRVGALVHHAVQTAGLDVPPQAARQLAARAQAIAQNNAAMAAEALRLQSLLDEAGIPVLTLKGPALAQLAYGRLALKHGRDIDLLVPPAQALAALALIERAGYALVDPAPEMDEAQRRAYIAFGREMELVHRDGRLRVELHWGLADNAALLRGLDCSAQRQDVAIDGGTLRTFTDADLFAYLCVHGAYHAWARLKWLADLNAWLAGKSAAEIARLYRHAQSRGAGLCAGQALVLCQRLLGSAMPPDLAYELKRPRVARLVATAMQAMIGRDAATEPESGFAGLTRGALRQFQLGEGLAFLAAQCRIVLVGHADVIRYPLPRAMHFLYPLVRLPLWLMRSTRFFRRGAGAQVPTRN